MAQTRHTAVVLIPPEPARETGRRGDRETGRQGERSLSSPEGALK